VDPIIPRLRKEPFDDPAWTFEPKLDGFRGIADTIHGRILSRNRNRFSRFDHLLDSLPDGVVLDGEIVVLDENGRPSFADLMRREGQPIYVAFDVLFVDWKDMRAEPLTERKRLLANLARRYRLQHCEHFVGQGVPLFRAVCEQGLEGIIAKRLADPYNSRAKWWKTLNPNYTLKEGRADLFDLAAARG
jgi:bifunctional non-homologous end joining protein LigD